MNSMVIFPSVYSWFCMFTSILEGIYNYNIGVSCKFSHHPILWNKGWCRPSDVCNYRWSQNWWINSPRKIPRFFVGSSEISHFWASSTTLFLQVSLRYRHRTQEFLTPVTTEHPPFIWCSMILLLKTFKNHDLYGMFHHFPLPRLFYRSPFPSHLLGSTARQVFEGFWSSGCRSKEANMA